MPQASNGFGDFCLKLPRLLKHPGQIRLIRRHLRRGHAGADGMNILPTVTVDGARAEIQIPTADATVTVDLWALRKLYAALGDALTELVGGQA